MRIRCQHARIASTRRLLFVSSALMLSGCSLINIADPPVQASKTHTTSHDADVKRIHIATTLGDITISPSGDMKEVTVSSDITVFGYDQKETDKRLAEATVEVKDLGLLGLLIEPKFPTPSYNSDFANITVYIPAKNSVAVTAESTTGNIRISEVGGSTTAETSTGSITTERTQGSMKVDSSTGKITITQHEGTLTVDSTTGDTKIDQQSGGAMTIDSSTGSITLTLAQNGAGPVKASTSTGDIDVSLGPAFIGEVELESEHGTLSVKDPSKRITKKNLAKSEGQIQLGAASPKSRLETSTGDLTVMIRSAVNEDKNQIKDETPAETTEDKSP